MASGALGGVWPVNHVRAMAALTVGGSAAGSGRGRGLLVVWVWVLTVGLLTVVCRSLGLRAGCVLSGCRAFVAAG
jgi:hypothetical protein